MKQAGKEVANKNYTTALDEYRQIPDLLPHAVLDADCLAKLAGGWSTYASAGLDWSRMPEGFNYWRRVTNGVEPQSEWQARAQALQTLYLMTQRV